MVSSSLQGALQIARASRRPERFDVVVAALTSRMRVKFGGTDLGELQELHE